MAFLLHLSRHILASAAASCRSVSRTAATAALSSKKTSLFSPQSSAWGSLSDEIFLPHAKHMTSRSVTAAAASERAIEGTAAAAIGGRAAAAIGGRAATRFREAHQGEKRFFLSISSSASHVAASQRYHRQQACVAVSLVDSSSNQGTRHALLLQQQEQPDVLLRLLQQQQADVPLHLKTGVLSSSRETLSACNSSSLHKKKKQQQQVSLQQQQQAHYSAAAYQSRRCFSSGTAAAAETYDVVVVGGGPGGYVAAIKAAQLGLRTACVEKRGSLGGTCLNVGCIPSKAVLNISNKFAEAREHFQQYGITGVTKESVAVDIARVQQQKQRIVKTLTQGIEFLFKRNNVHYVIGEGKLTEPYTVAVSSGEGEVKQQLHAKNIILATGSEPSPLPGNCVPIDEKIILSSTGALELPAVPKHLAVVGGGVIGLELGSVWRNFGAEVTVIEFLDRLLPPVDSEVAKAFEKEMTKIGIKFQLSTKVTGADIRADSATLHLEPARGGEKFQLEADAVLLAVGRRPFTKRLGLEELGIEKDKAGRVIVDSSFSTTRYPHIKAIGDLIAGPMLAHKAEEEGIACVEMIAGKTQCHVNYSTIPSVVYTHPEIAGVGKTEEELKEEGIPYGKGKFPFAANSRARCIDVSDGFVKVLTEKATDKIVGAWIIGPEAGELIAQLVLALEYGASAEDIARTCTAHPTLSEAVKEACMACYDKPIHIA